MLEPEFSVAIPEPLHETLLAHLLRADGQEDLTFALWSPSYGSGRQTALLNRVILPQSGDREVHGNVSFNLQYFERVCQEAMKAECGVAFLHSHLGPGWQPMSRDDVIAERRMAEPVDSLTELPLVGLTAGTDGAWSARAWVHKQGREYERQWCGTVRVVGPGLRITFEDNLLPPPRFRAMFQRTVTVWGSENHQTLARLRIGIVGLGSVGMMVAEALARMGFQRFVLIDFDEVQVHNLDRLLGATEADIGALKVEIGRRLIEDSHSADLVDIRTVPYSVAEDEGYNAALSCDVIFSCVDRPRPRQILNHVAYAHLIPVIDGGIKVRFRNGEFNGVDWQLQTVGPGRPCLQCLGTFTSADAETERAGKLDDPSYMEGLPKDHSLRQNENVFPFSMNLASLEVLHLIALVTGIAGVDSFGIQRFRYDPGVLEYDTVRTCTKNCDVSEFVGLGDRHFSYAGRDLGAEAARTRQQRQG